MGIPPFVPLDYVDLDTVPYVPTREIGSCEPQNFRPQDCASDCGYHCGEDTLTCPMLSQSFDDGPSEATSLLLDALKSMRLKTSFFVLGDRVILRPEIVRRQIAENHLVASHSWSHPYLPSLSNEEIAAEIQWSIWALNATAGIVPRFFRPPYGGIDARVRAIIKQFGLVTILWDHDSEDWRVNDGTLTHEEVLRKVRTWKARPMPRSWWQRLWSQSREPQKGGLILEHDLSYRNVYTGLAITAIIGTRQNNVAECAGGSGAWYQQRF